MEGKGGRFEMMENIEVVTDFLWGPWTPYVLLFAGVLFTVWTRFTQYKAMTHGVQVIRGVYDDPDDPGAINHFQALAAALSATVGLGNIGGVALAIGVGGPGALF
ncbi:MAG TPA: sodium:alanine symporter family protein, partial [Planctomycetes bacterium]|nr:sodium:alanine symporter family protein [Planctomycetota bacterium]